MSEMKKIFLGFLIFVGIWISIKMVVINPWSILAILFIFLVIIIFTLYFKEEGQESKHQYAMKEILKKNKEEFDKYEEDLNNFKNEIDKLKNIIKELNGLGRERILTDDEILFFKNIELERITKK